MGIKINWTDLNTLEPDEFRVYRSSTPIDPLNPPAALATVLGSVREYEDTTALRNTVYYYAVSAYAEGKGEVFSRSMCTGFFPYTGPGPQALLRGDFNSGVFGDIGITDIITPADLKALTGVPGTLVTNATRWVKVACMGKILFIPNYYVAREVSFDQLFAAGVVYSGIPQASWPPRASVDRPVVAQNKTFTKGEDVFNIRLLGTRKDRSSNTAVTSEYYGGEVDLGMFAMFLNAGNPAHCDQLYGMLAATTIWEPFVTGDFSGANIITRNMTTNGLVANAALIVPSSTSNSGWWPVLELVL